MLPLIITILAIVIFFGGRYLNDENIGKKAVASITIVKIDLSHIPDGVYDGKYDVGYISAKVEFGVANGAIKTINLIEHQNERGSTGEVITDIIIKEQKIDVDTV